jgi:hypothetical protein
MNYNYRSALLFILLACSLSAFAKVDPAKLAEFRKWKARSTSLEKILIRNGWWRTNNDLRPSPESRILVNKKFTKSYALYASMMGSATEPRIDTIEKAGRASCYTLRKSRPGSKYVFSYNAALEISSCWVYSPAVTPEKTEQHTFIILKSAAKGSRSYIAETGTISVDPELNSKGPHQIARKIASAAGVK